MPPCSSRKSEIHSAFLFTKNKSNLDLCLCLLTLLFSLTIETKNLQQKKENLRVILVLTLFRQRSKYHNTPNNSSSRIDHRWWVLKHQEKKLTFLFVPNEVCFYNSVSSNLSKASPISSRWHNFRRANNTSRTDNWGSVFFGVASFHLFDKRISIFFLLSFR